MSTILERYIATTGSDTNGGSSEGAAKYSGTGWTASSTTVTATNIGKSPVAVNDLVYLANGTGGYNTTWFKITTINSDNEVVVHAAPGAGNAGYAWAVGGAIASPSVAALIVQPGDRWNIKDTADYTAIVTWAVNGNILNRIYLRGYSSTITDGERCTFAVTNPGAGSGGSVFKVTGDFYVIENINVECVAAGTNGQSAFEFTSASIYNKVINCRGYVSNPNATYTHSGCANSAEYSVFINCEFEVGTDTSVRATAFSGISHAIMFGCRFKGKVWVYTYRATRFAFCTFDFRGNSFLDFDGSGEYPHFLINCSLYNGGSTALLEVDNTLQLVLVNSIFYGTSGYGVKNLDKATTCDNITLINCAFGNCTQGHLDFEGNETDIGHITLTADPFVDAANGDFRLNNDAGGGALCRSAGYPYDLTFNGTQDSWGDLGAHQVKPAVVPAIGDVKSGTVYYDNGGGSLTGTYSASGGVANLLSGLVS